MAMQHAQDPTRTRKAMRAVCIAAVMAVVFALATAATMLWESTSLHDSSRAYAAPASGDIMTAQGSALDDLLAGVDKDAVCSYSARVQDQAGVFMTGVSVRIWRIASMEQGYPLVGKFADLPMAYDPTAPGFSWQDIAETLRGLAEANGIGATDEGFTGDAGTVTFSNLKTGMYLVVTDAGNTPASDGALYTFRPVIVSLPTVVIDDEGTQYVYDVTSDMDKYAPQSEDEVVYEVRKMWDGDAGYESSRPQSVTINLYRTNGSTTELYDTVELNADNNWSYEWTSDQKYSWSVAEEGLGANYTYVVHADRNYDITPSEGVFTVTNTYNPPSEDDVQFKVVKQWDDSGKENVRPDGLSIQIYCDGNLAQSATLTAAGKWTYSWHAEKGHVWSVVEALENAPYAHTIVVEGDGDVGAVFNITNTYDETEQPDTVSYKVKKQWSGDTASSRPKSVTIQLIKDGKKQSEVTLDASNNWQHSWTSKSDAVWTVSEKGVPSGYTAVVSSEGSKAAGITFTVENKGKTTTATPPTRTDTPSSSTGFLPKTGDVRWPIAPLVCAGIASFIVALLLSRRRRRAND